MQQMRGTTGRVSDMRLCAAAKQDLESPQLFFPVRLVSDDILRDFYKPIKPKNKNQSCDFCNRIFERKLL